MSAEDVRIVREALGPKVPEKHASYLERCRNHTIAALDRLEARLAEVEKERDDAIHNYAELRPLIEDIRVRAEAAERKVEELEAELAGEGLRQSDAIAAEVGWDGVTTSAERAQARIEELEAALREIDALESDGGTYAVEWADHHGWIPVFKAIARRTLEGQTKEEK